MCYLVVSVILNNEPITVALSNTYYNSKNVQTSSHVEVHSTAKIPRINFNLCRHHSDKFIQTDRSCSVSNLAHLMIKLENWEVLRFVEVILCTLLMFLFNFQFKVRREDFLKLYNEKSTKYQQQKFADK